MLLLLLLSSSSSSSSLLLLLLLLLLLSSSLLLSSALSERERGKEREGERERGRKQEESLKRARGIGSLETSIAPSFETSSQRKPHLPPQRLLKRNRVTRVGKGREASSLALAAAAAAATPAALTTAGAVAVAVSLSVPLSFSLPLSLARAFPFSLSLAAPLPFPISPLPSASSLPVAVLKIALDSHPLPILLSLPTLGGGAVHLSLYLLPLRRHEVFSKVKEAVRDVKLEFARVAAADACGPRLEALSQLLWRDLENVATAEAIDDEEATVWKLVYVCCLERCSRDSGPVGAGGKQVGR